METTSNFLKNHHGELNDSLYISLLFFNFMPKQSTHVAGYIAPFSLCEIYRSNINDNSYLMSADPPPSAHSVLFSKLSHTTFRQLRCVRWRRYWDKTSAFSQIIPVRLFAMWWFYFRFYSRRFCWTRAAKCKARPMFLTDECELCINFLSAVTNVLS